MKKLVFASVMALASMSLVIAPTLRAQDQITIKDPAEFNAYQMATTQTDPKAKAAAWRAFSQTYPQSVVKKPVLDTLMDTYQGVGRSGQGAQRGEPAAAGRSQQHEGHLLLGAHQEEPVRQDQRRADLRRCRGAGRRRASRSPSPPAHLRRRLEEADRRGLSRSSTRRIAAR